jgi:hypothetical protein
MNQSRYGVVIFTCMFLVASPLSADGVSGECADCTVAVYQTAKNSDDRLAYTGTYTFEVGQQPPENEVSVFVNPEKRFQRLLGIGGAITDASAEVFAELPEPRQVSATRWHALPFTARIFPVEVTRISRKATRRSRHSISSTTGRIAFH